MRGMTDGKQVLHKVLPKVNLLVLPKVRTKKPLKQPDLCVNALIRWQKFVL